MKKRIVILGAGAAGLMAAIKAGETGAEVVVLEHTDAIGKKLLMTGNGRCNYTNTDLSLSHFHSLSDPDKTFIGKALSSFGYGETIDFFRSLGIEPRIRRYGYDNGGYVYPASGEARSVLKALKSEADFLDSVRRSERGSGRFSRQLDECLKQSPRRGEWQGLPLVVKVCVL